MKQILELKEPVGTILKSVDLFNKIKKINIDYSQENVLIFCLDTKNKIIDTEIMFKGGLNSCVFDIKTIFRKSLIKNSNSIIIAHNHPSGDLTPSLEDNEVSYKLKEAGKVITLKVLDFIIFNKNEFYTVEGLKENTA